VATETAEVTLYANLEGIEDVNAGFASMGASAEGMGRQVSESTERMNVNYRTLFFTTAGLITNSVQLGDIMDRMAKGQMDLGRGALMLGMNFLQLAGQLYILNYRYGESIAAKNASIIADFQEAASASAHTAAERVREAAVVVSSTAHGIFNAIKASSIAIDIHHAASAIAHAVAEGVRQAALWASVIAENAMAIAWVITESITSFGAAVPFIIAAAAGAAVAVGAVLAAQGNIPHFAEGAIVQTPTFALIGERGPEAVLPLNKFLSSSSTNMTVNLTINESRTPRETGDAVIDALRRRGIM
jgi:hypothetical protein